MAALARQPLLVGSSELAPRTPPALACGSPAAALWPGRSRKEPVGPPHNPPSSHFIVRAIAGAAPPCFLLRPLPLLGPSHESGYMAGCTNEYTHSQTHSRPNRNRWQKGY